MTAKVAARIAQLRAEGMPLPAALDAVLGAGSYDAFVSDLYDRLREVAHA